MNRTEKLSEYLDGMLDAEEAGALEARLEREPALRALVEELRAVKEAAARAPTFKAPPEIWDSVRRRITTAEPRGQTAVAGAGRGGDRGGRLALTLPQLAAAAGIVLLLGIGVGRMSGPGAGSQGAPLAEGPSPSPAAATSAAPPAGSVTAVLDSTAGPTGGNYAQFVADMEARLSAGRDVLDPETARVLEESLATIDTAIARANEALESDPNSVYLNQHLAGARSRKLRLLENATALIASRT